MSRLSLAKSKPISTCCKFSQGWIEQTVPVQMVKYLKMVSALRNHHHLVKNRPKMVVAAVALLSQATQEAEEMIVVRKKAAMVTTRRLGNSRNKYSNKAEMKQHPPYMLT
jgi:hypothetical protein